MSRDTQMIYGLHAVRHALEAAPEFCLELWLHNERADAAIQTLSAIGVKSGVAVHSADGRTLDKLVERARHQGAVLRRRVAPSLGDQELQALVQAAGPDLLLLALDGVEDPNMFRTSEHGGEAATASLQNVKTLPPSPRRARRHRQVQGLRVAMSEHCKRL